MTAVPASPQSPNLALLLGLAWLVVVAQLLADHWAETAQTFPDMDDAMRMVEVRGFLEEDGIAPDSTTETYAAIRLGVDTRRWAGVPFFLRTGKRLPRRMTEIALIFQRAPHLPFTKTDTEELDQNALVIRVQPDEGVTVRFGSKVPGSAMEVRDVNMDFAYGESFTESSPEAYERLLLEVLIGDAPLFPHQEEVELSWQVLDPIEEFWAEYVKPEPYPAGSAGPPGADVLMSASGRAWRRL